MSSMHDSIFAQESFLSLSSFKSKDRYSCILSVYMCTCMTCLWAMLAIADEYMVKNMGPITDPWGTPNAEV